MYALLKPCNRLYCNGDYLSSCMHYLLDFTESVLLTAVASPTLVRPYSYQLLCVTVVMCDLAVPFS